jgi:hypothetical protein
MNITNIIYLKGDNFMTYKEIQDIISENKTVEKNIYSRLSAWTMKEIKVTQLNGEIENHKCLWSDGIIENVPFKGHFTDIKVTIGCLINNDKKIIWLGSPNCEYYFCNSKGIFGLSCTHDYIYLYQNELEDDENINISNNDYDILDKILFTKAKKKSFLNSSYSICFHDSFDRKDKFYTKNLENSTRYKIWPDDFMRINSINIKDGLLRIDIENISYPFYGHILFDLEEFTIVEAKKD